MHHFLLFYMERFDILIILVLTFCSYQDLYMITSLSDFEDFNQNGDDQTLSQSIHDFILRALISTRNNPGRTSLRKHNADSSIIRWMTWPSNYFFWFEFKLLLRLQRMVNVLSLLYDWFSTFCKFFIRSFHALVTQFLLVAQAGPYLGVWGIKKPIKISYFFTCNPLKILVSLRFTMTCSRSVIFHQLNLFI